MDLSKGVIQASAVAYLQYMKQEDAARVLRDSNLEFILEFVTDGMEEVPIHVLQADLGGMSENTAALDAEDGLISTQIRDALNASTPTNYFVRSVGAHVEVGKLGPNLSTTAYELLKGNNLHNDVLEACESELLAENYYHALLEATKSVARKIQRLSGLDFDGRDLVNKAFGGNTPALAANPLATTTDWSDQEGFFFLLQGMFATIRNLTAHVPKHENSISELEAADFLSFVSYIHRRLDRTIKNTENKQRPPKAI